jgi:1-acyl-sn-glycerol-3-phosphate acyltransferase
MQAISQMLKYLRSGARVAACSLITVILITATLCALPFDRGGRAQQGLFRFWAHCMLAVCGVRVSVSGADSIDWGKKHIFVSNHTSLIDAPVLVACLPVPLCFLAKNELFRAPILGVYLRTTGHIPVDRTNSRSALHSFKEAARALRNGRRSLLLFPEGTRSQSTLNTFKEGAALIGIQSAVPIVPIAIIGAAKVLPSKSLTLEGGCVDLRLGTPIATDGLSIRDRTKLTERLRDEVARLSSL